VGALLARSWYLPEVIGEAILLHHDMRIFSQRNSNTSSRAATLIAVSRTAEHINHSFSRLSDDPEWASISGNILKYLGLGESEFEDMQEHIHQLMEGQN
jgi:HD-like signal output (HDOD) protein